MEDKMKTILEQMKNSSDEIKNAKPLNKEEIKQLKEMLK